MPSRPSVRLLAAIIACLSLPALAQAEQPAPAPAPSCPATPAPLAGIWAGWREKAPVIDAGRALNAIPGLAIGVPATLRLAPLADITLASSPDRALEPGTNGGLATLVLDKAARIGIGLSSGAWIDVISGGQAVKSSAHEHGPPCSGIRKIVWFDLPAGSHIVQLISAKTPTLTVMAVLESR